MSYIRLITIAFAIWGGAASAGQYLQQKADFSVYLNNRIIFDAVSNLSYTEYRGDYVTNGRICSSPWFRLRLDSLTVEADSKINLITGLSAVNLNPKFSVFGQAEQCVPNGFQVQCRGLARVNDLFNPIPVGARCNLKAVVLNVPVFKSQSIDLIDPIGPILKLKRPIEFRLTDTDNIKMEFGEFVDDKWVPSKTRHLKEINLSTFTYGARGERKERHQNLTSWRDTKVLVTNLMVGKPYLVPHLTRDDAEVAYQTVSNFDNDNDLLKISISSSFFSKRSVGGANSGLFGEVLPIRIFGEEAGQKFDVALVDASVKFGKFEGEEQAIVVGFKIKSISSGAYIKNAGAHFAFQLPKIENNKIVTELISAKIQIGTEHFSGSVCLDRFITDNILSDNLELADIAKPLDFSLPDCIEVAGNRMQPDGRCKNGKTRGVMKRHGNQTNTRISLNTELLRVEDANSDSFTIVIPAEVTTYQH